MAWLWNTAVCSRAHEVMGGYGVSAPKSPAVSLHQEATTPAASSFLILDLFCLGDE